MLLRLDFIIPCFFLARVKKLFTWSHAGVTCRTTNEILFFIFFIYFADARRKYVTQGIESQGLDRRNAIEGVLSRCCAKSPPK